MRRLNWIGILGLIVLVGLAGCGGGETAVSDTSTATNDQETETETAAATLDTRAETVEEPSEATTPTAEASPVETTTLLAFAGEAPEAEGDIYTIDSMGSNLVNLTNSPEDDNTPAWSPDGSQIVWVVEVSDDVDELVVMNADGSNRQTLTSMTGTMNTPAWSPDGAQIVFRAEPADGDPDIYAIDADGGHLRQLTATPANDTSPSWSPDGSQILFAAAEDGIGDIFVMNADGSSVTAVTTTPDDEESPEWSPDGTQIAYVLDANDNEDIYVMNADGSNPQQLTTHPENDDSPTWSPDGRFILFNSDRNGNGDQLYVVSVDGSDVRLLAGNESLEAGAAAVQPAGGVLVAFGGETVDETAVAAVGDNGEETAVVNSNELINTLSLTEVTYSTESFMGSQTESSILAGNCIAQLMNGGQLLLYGDDSFEFLPADPGSLANCFAFEDTQPLTGSYEITADSFSDLLYDFSGFLTVLGGNEPIDVSINGFVGDQLPSGNYNGGFSFSIQTSGDFGAGDILYLVEGDVLADAGAGGTEVAPIDVAYSLEDALAATDPPIVATSPPNYAPTATSNGLSFGIASQIPAAEAVELYKGYMSSLGWSLSNEFTEGNTTNLNFARGAESAFITIQDVLATIVNGRFELFGEPWAAVPQVPLLADAQLGGLFYSQNYELPADTSLEAVAQYYQDLSAGELAAAGWTFESSSSSDTISQIIWSRPSGQSSVYISDVSSQNKVGVSVSYNYAAPLAPELAAAVAATGAAQTEAMLTQFELNNFTVNTSEETAETAVSALCNGNVDVASTVSLLDDAAKQACGSAQVVEFIVGQVPFAIVINQANDWAAQMTAAEAAQAFTTAETWADVNPGWPDTPIVRFVPQTGSAGYELLVDGLLGGDAAELTNAANLAQLARPFDIVWSGIGDNPAGIGFAPMDAVVEYEDVASAVTLEGVAPTSEGYPLSLPLALLTFDATMQAKLPVAAFIGQAIVSGADAAAEVGYRPVDAATQQANEALWLEIAGE